MKERMNKVSDAVYSILTENEEARNSDRVLFHEFYKKYYEAKNVNFDYMSASAFLLDRYAPPIESVRRSRQKIQEHHPWLRADAIIADIRDEKQDAMRQWALSKEARHETV